MSADGAALVAIALMAAVTFATRAAGYLALRATRPGPRLERFLQAAPKTMFVALVTPALAQGGIAEWLGAAAAIAAMRLTRNLLAAIACATVAVALVRTLTAV